MDGQIPTTEGFRIVCTGLDNEPKKGNFGINDNCMRGQTATFLYRAKDIK